MFRQCSGRETRPGRRIQSDINTLPRPDFFFMWIFAVAALMPEYMETFGLLVVPPVVILILFALPFFNNTGEKSWRRRPIAMLTVVLHLPGNGHPYLPWIYLAMVAAHGRMERCSH